MGSCLLFQFGRDPLHSRRTDIRTASFQGMRYELALAAAFTRAGFRVDWLAESSTKHGEFTIALGDEQPVVVEAKSRHRAGILHEAGTREDPRSLGADVKRLYERALTKETDGCPLLICIDVNLPLQSEAPRTTPSWAEYVREFLDQRPPTEAAPAKEFSLSLTNFNWHYRPHEVAGGQRYIYTFPEWTQCAPKGEDTYAGILQAFHSYGQRPEGPY